MEQQQQRAVFQVHREITPLHRGEKKNLRATHGMMCPITPVITIGAGPVIFRTYDKLDKAPNQ